MKEELVNEGESEGRQEEESGRIEKRETEEERVMERAFLFHADCPPILASVGA